MKKKLMLMILLGAFVFGLSSCNEEPVDNPIEDPVAPVEPVEPEIKNYTVTFNNCDNSIEAVTLEANKKIIKPTDPIKDGYVFGGWYTDLNYTNKFDFNSRVTSNLDLYAKFAKINNITFDSDGGTEFTNISYTELENVSLPIPSKSGYIFSCWKDQDNNEYTSIPKGLDKDLNLKAVYHEPSDISVKLGVMANDYNTGVMQKDIGIYNVKAEVRGRIQTWTNPNDENEKISWNQSFKIGSSAYYIKVTAPADGTLEFYIQNGSSSAATQKVIIECSDGTSNTYEFSGATTALDGYPSGSPVVKIEHAVKEGLTYTIKRNSGTIDIYECNLTCNVKEENITSIALKNSGEVNYVEGDKIDLAGLKVNAIYGDNLYTKEIDNKDLYVDCSNVDFTKAGEYEAIIKYGQFELPYKISIYEIDDIVLGFNETYEDNNSYNMIFVNGNVQTIYEINEELNNSYLTVIANASLGDKSRQFIVDGIVDFDNFDSKSAGVKEVNVVLSINSKEFSASYNIYVLDTTPYVNANEEYVVTVDKNYTGIIGQSVAEDGNMFTTISQALQFLEGEEIDQSKDKIMNVKKGYYEEKIEINIPNLTIKGEGVSKATYANDKAYNAESYSNATIIEWDSLYGVCDESGYSQVTDSTATVAVREKAINCTIENITLSNKWNCEEYFQAEIEFLTAEGIAVNGKVNDHRALALIVQADKFTMNNCALLGYQDTVEFMTGRQYVVNTYISGNTDYIFGTNCTTYFYNCEIFVNYKSGGSGYITAVKGCNKGSEDYINYGFIFDACKFTADSRVSAGSFAIGRPWGEYSCVMVMNSEIGAHINKTTKRYVSMGGVLPSDETVRYMEYNNTGDSAITESSDIVDVLSQVDASKYNDISVIFGKENGMITYKDSWEPELYK